MISLEVLNSLAVGDQITYGKLLPGLTDEPLYWTLKSIGNATWQFDVDFMGVPWKSVKVGKVGEDQYGPRVTLTGLAAFRPEQYAPAPRVNFGPDITKICSAPIVLDLVDLAGVPVCMARALNNLVAVKGAAKGCVAGCNFVIEATEGFITWQANTVRNAGIAYHMGGELYLVLVNGSKGCWAAVVHRPGTAPENPILFRGLRESVSRLDRFGKTVVAAYEIGAPQGDKPRWRGVGRRRFVTMKLAICGVGS